jgi:hypothetical protein
VLLAGTKDKAFGFRFARQGLLWVKSEHPAASGFTLPVNFRKPVAP